MENVYKDKTNPKKARVAKLISDKVDFCVKIITRNKEDHFIIIKGLIHQEKIKFFTFVCLVTQLKNTWSESW